jgi:hypothetical protein
MFNFPVFKHIQYGSVRLIWVWLSAVCMAMPALAVSEWRYTIRPGDTVSGLSKEHLKLSVSWATLANYNDLTNPNMIKAGKQLRIPLKWLMIKQAHAELTTVSGDVQVLSEQGQWRQALLGERVQTGEQVRVGTNSSGRLRFADGSVLVIQPESSLSMDSLSLYGGGYMADTQLRLQSGRVEVNANPSKRKGQQFNVITPAAVASVRGTQFVLEAQADRTLGQTSEGSVALRNDFGTVLVNEGFSSAVKAGEKPMEPTRTQSGPVLLNAATVFQDFPVTFTLEDRADVTSWVLQVGLDAQMASLLMTQETNRPFFDVTGLHNGLYHLRVWSVDSQALPSAPTNHVFEVAIPRLQKGPPVKLSPQFFARGTFTLNLEKLAPTQRYFVQLTQDEQGMQSVWHTQESGSKILIPPPPKPDQAHYLWIWVY